jgi:DNA polymerase-3 subunit delta
MQNPQKICLLAGPDTFLKSLYLDAQREAFHKRRIDFDWQVFYPPEPGIREILDFARTFPLFKKQRFIIVKDIQLLLPADKETLLRFVKIYKPLPSTSLILESSDYPDADNFHRQLCRHCVTKRFAPLKDKEIEGWVRSRLRAQHKKISLEALRLLIENFGGDIAGLYNAVNNLIIYTENKELIGYRDARNFSGQDMESSVFDLVDALWEKDVQKALLILRILLTENKNRPPQIIGLINYQLSRILKAKILIEKGTAAGEINRKLKLPYARSQKFISQVKHISFAAIEKIRQALIDTDFNIKTGRRDAGMALEIFLTRAGNQL